MAITNQQVTSAGEVVEKREPSCIVGGKEEWHSPMESSMEFPQKTKNGTAFDPEIPLLGLYPKNPETPIQKNLCTLMVIAAIFIIAKC